MVSSLNNANNRCSVPILAAPKRLASSPAKANNVLALGE